MAPSPPLEKQYMSTKTSKTPSIPRPSSSILLLSPQNEILLLHRVRTSSSFPSAHVFPGGNLSSSQDGAIPAPEHSSRHEDSEAYRLCAVRECFEESGILLVTAQDGNELLNVDEAERERARKEIHAGNLKFSDWVASLGGKADTGALMPFTRWITPPNLPKRFTTQMYIYFLPLAGVEGLPVDNETVIPIPTSDGGLEHTAAIFESCETWLKQAHNNEIILFPPQFYLMSLLAPFLKPELERALERTELLAQREEVVRFLDTDGDGRGIKWGEKVMSPIGLSFGKDGRSILSLIKPGPELQFTARGGDYDRVVLVKFGKEGPRDLEIRKRSEVMSEKGAKL